MWRTVNWHSCNQNTRNASKSCMPAFRMALISVPQYARTKARCYDNVTKILVHVPARGAFLFLSHNENQRGCGAYSTHDGKGSSACYREQVQRSCTRRLHIASTRSRRRHASYGASGYRIGLNVRSACNGIDRRRTNCRRIDRRGIESWGIQCRRVQVRGIQVRRVQVRRVKLWRVQFWRVQFWRVQLGRIELWRIQLGRIQAKRHTSRQSKRKHTYNDKRHNPFQHAISPSSQTASCGTLLDQKID